MNIFIKTKKMQTVLKQMSQTNITELFKRKKILI